ncbi:MAG TPA: pro-sigmaK processing inhibitor BofA family protein [Bacillota bacterium]|nr:pro-sigmaK processing inhibitor BofA family protein [Bacillota bacterium]
MSATIIWLIVALGVVLLSILFGQSIWRPVKWLGYGLFKVAMGALLLFVFNSFGGYYDFTIPINPITAALSGFLGIPGLAALAVIKGYFI